MDLTVLSTTRGRRSLFAAAVAVQLVALYWPRPVDPGSGLPLDKLVHLAIFGAVSWTGIRAGLRPLPLVALLVVHAGLSEVVQGTLLDRDGNLPDAVADTLGTVLGWLAAVRGPGAPVRPRPGTPADGAAADRR